MKILLADDEVSIQKLISGLLEDEGHECVCVEDGTDALEAFEPVSFSRVLGTPVFCIPYLGYVNVFCTTMPGILIVALVALALIAASYATSGMRRKAATAQ